MILLDEPELGLHPAAIAILAALLERCAWKSQILAATQSVTQVWIVDRVNGVSIFRHLAHEEVEAWIDGYALGELMKRVLVLVEGQTEERFVKGGPCSLFVTCQVALFPTIITTKK